MNTETQAADQSVKRSSILFKLIVSLAAFLRMAVKPKNLACLLAFVAGQMSWALMVVVAIMLGDSPVVVAMFWATVGITLIVWLVVAVAVVRLAIVGARLFADGQVAGLGELPPPEGEETAKEQTP